MSYLEGVGDEVVGLLVSVLAVSVVALLWKTTQVRDSPPIHSVVITADRIRAYGFPGANNAAGRAGAGHSHQHTHEEQTEPPGTENENLTEQEDISEEESNENSTPDHNEDSVNIKLKFLDESELDVTTRLSECLKKFRKRHLDTHLSLSPTDKVKLIFNGKIIHRDGQKLSEAGIYDNCTVHCLVQRIAPGSTGSGQDNTGSQQTTHGTTTGNLSVGPHEVGSDLDLQTLCFPLLGTILFGCWWFALFYSQHFTMLSLTSLVSLTVLYAASLANLIFY